MALSISKTVARYQDVSGIRKRVIVAITFDSSYPTGGESLLPGDVGLGKIEYFPTFRIVNSTPTTFTCVYDYTNQKLLAYATHATPGGTVADIEVTNGENLSTFTGRVEIVGY